MSIKIRIEKELHETWFYKLLGRLVLGVSVQLSVLILAVLVGPGRIHCCVAEFIILRPSLSS